MSKILYGDALECLKTIPDNSVNMCVTSPPYYGLRDYGIDEQIGMEVSPVRYIEKLVCIFREIQRILKNDGTLWVNIADSYAGSIKSRIKLSDNAEIAKEWQGIKSKDMLGIPWSLAFALRDDGWYLRSDIIWQKSNCMPESVKDRPTKSYEHIFLLSTTTFVAQLFVIYNRDVPFVTRSVPDYYFSLGRIMLSRIATIAAGTIPEPPKTSWSS